MKTSEVLERALAEFGEDGEKWVNRVPLGTDTSCAVIAIARVGGDARFAAWDLLYDSLGLGLTDCSLARWNDTRKDFSEIRTGFLKAIELARKQEQANAN